MLIAKTVVDAVSDLDKADVLDACAAPGGKTSAIKHYDTDNKINCYSLELHKHRVELMEKDFARLNIDAKCYRHDSSKTYSLRRLIACWWMLHALDWAHYLSSLI